MAKLSTEEFINRCKKKYGDKYLYYNVSYLDIFSSVIITCPLHGDFEVIARNFLRGTECQKCRDRFNKSHFDKTELFIDKAKRIHGDKYDYSKSLYNSYKDKIEIICSIHGSFYQSPLSHLRGKNCYKCAKERWNIEYNIPKRLRTIKENWINSCAKLAYLYIIKCYNDTEEFLKVGICKYQDIRKRYTCKSSIPYRFEVLKIVEQPPNIIWNMEKEILKDNLAYVPSIKFAGSTECLELSSLSKIENYICLTA